MTEFVRESDLLISGTFIAADGTDVQPANAEAVISYIDLSGARRKATVALTLGADGLWRGYWDNSNSQGHVDWKVRGWGGYKGADQGSFATKIDPTL